MNQQLECILLWLQSSAKVGFYIKMIYENKEWKLITEKCGSLNWTIIQFQKYRDFIIFPHINMKVSEQMVAEEGQISEEKVHLQPPNLYNLQQQKSLMYNVLRWNHKQQNSQRLLELQVVLIQQLPELPSEYIHSIISDKHHISLIMILQDLVVGGSTFRLFQQQSLAEIVFFAIDQHYQGQGFGKRLMDILKEFLNTQSIKNILTFADDSARIFFKKQGFSKNITLSPSIWKGFIKQYSGSKLMQCKISSSINYILSEKIIQKQKNYINQQLKKACLMQIFPKKKLISAIKQKKGFLDPFPNTSLPQLVKKLPGFHKYEHKSQYQKLNLSNFKLSIQDECKDLMYEILTQSQTSQFHLDKYFYEKILDSQNKLKGVNFPTIFRKIQNGEYSKLKQFIEDLNSFMMLIQDKYKYGEKKESARKLRKFLQQRIENLRNLQQVLSVKQVQSSKIQQKRLELKNQ